MRKLVLILTMAVIFALGSSVSYAGGPYTGSVASDSYDSFADAVPTPNDTAVSQNIHDAVNLLLGTAHTSNEDVDFLQHTSDDRFWHDLSTTSFEGTYVTIGLTAANSNTLNVYDVTAPAIKIPVLGPYSGFTFLGDGTVANPYPASMSPLAGGTDFGWELVSSGSGGTNKWNSDPTKNSDLLDHMMTYHLASLKGTTVQIDVGGGPVDYTFFDPYLIVFEDKAFDPLTGKLGDEDYNDIMFLVDRVSPVPEPASMMLLGSGLFGLVGLRRKKA